MLANIDGKPAAPCKRASRRQIDQFRDRTGDPLQSLGAGLPQASPRPAITRLVPTPRHPDIRRSHCPIASALDLFGDRWTLIFVRDLPAAKARFVHLAAAPERIPTNILSDRLRELERTGVVGRSAYPSKPPRFEYRLTAKGRELLPILEAMATWSKRHDPGQKDG